MKCSRAMEEKVTGLPPLLGTMAMEIMEIPRRGSTASAVLCIKT